jgi:hypothetical protein
MFHSVDNTISETFGVWQVVLQRLKVDDTMSKDDKIQVCIVHFARSGGPQSLHTFRSHLQILGAGMVMWSGFHPEDLFYSNLWTAPVSGAFCWFRVDWYKFLCVTKRKLSIMPKILGITLHNLFGRATWRPDARDMCPPGLKFRGTAYAIVL